MDQTDLGLLSSVVRGFDDRLSLRKRVELLFVVVVVVVLLLSLYCCWIFVVVYRTLRSGSRYQPFLS